VRDRPKAKEDRRKGRRKGKVQCACVCSYMCIKQSKDVCVSTKSKDQYGLKLKRCIKPKRYVKLKRCMHEAGSAQARLRKA